MSFPLVFSFSALAAQLTLAWDPIAAQNLAGYRVYCGTATRTYGLPINVGKETVGTITGLTLGKMYYCSVTAYSSSGNESGFSNEVSGTAKDPSTSQNSLVTGAIPAGGGTVSPSGTNWYGSGQSVSIKATANPGYIFSHWSGNLSGTTNPTSIVMNGSKSITANFVSQTGFLEVTPSAGLSASGRQGGPFQPSQTDLYFEEYRQIFLDLGRLQRTELAQPIIRLRELGRRSQHGSHGVYY